MAKVKFEMGDKKLKLEVEGENTEQVLKEIRAMSKEFQKTKQEPTRKLEEDFLEKQEKRQYLRLFDKLSKPLLEDKEIMDLIMADYKEEHTSCYIITNTTRHILEIKKKGKKANAEVKIDLETLQKEIDGIKEHFYVENVNHAVLHIKTSLKKQETDKIIDLFKQRMDFPKITTKITKEKTKKTHLELVLLGEGTLAKRKFPLFD